MTREEAQAAWSKIVDIGFTNYEQLSREQRVWFNLEPLTIDGLWDHYVNHGADTNADTIEDLVYLGFDEVANQMRAFNQVYFPNGVPKGPDARQAQFDKFPEEKLEKDIEEMDAKFWAVADELDNKILEHINTTGIGKM
jgi:hypothetical protein